MDDPVPAIDFSPSGSADSSYSLEREDVEGKFWSPVSYFEPFSLSAPEILHVVYDLEQFARSNNDPVALSAIIETHSSLEKLVAKMDSLEAGFDRIAERSRTCPKMMNSIRILNNPNYLVLSASRLSSSRRRCECTIMKLGRLNY